jgi:hypothetical protein
MLTLQQIKNEVRRMDPGGYDEDNEETQATIVMLSALIVGTNKRKLHAFTGVAPPLIAKFSRNLREHGVWRGGKTYCAWGEKSGYIALILDTLVAIGQVVRTDDWRSRPDLNRRPAR